MYVNVGKGCCTDSAASQSDCMQGILDWNVRVVHYTTTVNSLVLVNIGLRS